jgi:hypothetical protein
MRSEVVDRFEREIALEEYSKQLPDTWMWRVDANEQRERLIRKEDGPRRLARWRVNKRLSEMTPAEDPRMFLPSVFNLGLDQRATDDVSFTAMMAKRIVKTTEDANRQNFRDEEQYGQALWLALKKKMGWNHPVPLDQLRFEQSCAKFQERRADRSQALQKASLNRSDPLYQDFISGKTQWKLKTNEITNAKALQCIYTRSDAYLFQFGPWGVYLLDLWLEHAPASFYMHACKTEADLQQWVFDHDPGDTYLQNDIESFDQSVRGAGVHLMVQFMEFFGVPIDVRDAYVDDKMSVHTRSFVIRLMTLSGEIFTWLVNTLFSTARESLKYDLPVADPMMVTGDDVERFVRRPVSGLWEMYSSIDHCVEVRDETVRGSFCSYAIFRGKVWKDPVMLYRRLSGQLERGNARNVIDGYLLHYLTIYNLGDEIYSLFTELEMQCAQALNDFFFHIRRHTGLHLKVKWSHVRTGHEVWHEAPDIVAPIVSEVLTAVADVFLPQGSQYARDELYSDYARY